MGLKDSQKPNFVLANQNRIQLRKVMLALGIGATLIVAGILATQSSEEMMASSYPVSEDQDQDNIPNWYDFDDDNDGIPDTEEQDCENLDYGLSTDNDAPDGISFPSLQGITMTPNYTENVSGTIVQMGVSTADAIRFKNNFTHVSQTNELEINLSPALKQGFLRFTDFDQSSSEDYSETYTITFSNAGTSVSYIVDYMGENLNQAGNTFTAYKGGNTSNDSASILVLRPILEVDKMEIVAGAIQNASGTNPGSMGSTIRIGSCDRDTDGDGLTDHLDLDSDGDGIADIIEAGGTDSDGDGQVAYPIAGDPTSIVDTDGDGVADSIDDVDSGSGVSEYTSGTPWPLTNTDGEGNPDFLDIDADDDGIVDNTEAQSTSGYTAPTGTDTDGDGIDDSYDVDCDPCGGVTGVAIVPVNTGGSADPDYQDSDTDGDGFADSLEGHDTNGDGVVDGSDTPSANTGLAGGTTDIDGDGLLDGFDNDTDPDNYDATNGGMTANSHPDAQGVTSERDWREDASLPVEWLAFNAELVNNYAQLTWSTASELNSDYFQIERSSDGRIFEEVGKVNSVGTTMNQSDYQYLDSDITSTDNGAVLYRLRQVDLNGAFDYSKVVELQIGEVEVNISLKAYPNPVSDFLNINIGYTGGAELSIVNVSGQVVFSKELDPTQISTELQIPVADWADGIYIVRLNSGAGQASQQIVVN